MDRDGRVTLMSAVAEQLTGWPQEEARGRLLPEVFRLYSATTSEPLPCPVTLLQQSMGEPGAGGNARSGPHGPPPPRGVETRASQGPQDISCHPLAASCDLCLTGSGGCAVTQTLQRETQSVLDAQALLLTRHGIHLPIEGEMTTIWLPDGSGSDGAVLVFRDVAERHRAEELLRQSERRLALEATTQGVWDWDIETSEVFYSPTWIASLGYTPTEVPPHASFWLSIVHLDDVPQALAHLRAHVCGETPFFTTEVRLCTRAGVYRWYCTSGKVVQRDAHGRALRMVGVDIDITARKRAEAVLREERASLEQRVAERTAELSRTNAELARANHLKNEFLASMSHELRTPLSTILGLTEALQEQLYGPLTAQQSARLHTIAQSGKHLLALITDILDLSKIEAGTMTIHIHPVFVVTVCEGSLQFVTQQAQAKHLRMVVTYDPAVTTVPADARRLKQMLVNLLSNAVKFTPPGRSVGLDVQGDPRRQAVHFTVWDTGPGIPEEQLPLLFQPFVQLDRGLTRQHEGTGLGLSLVYRMAMLHGGGVRVDSAPGEGSRFTVSLPWGARRHERVEPLATTPPTVVPQGHAPPRQGAGGLPCVLIADDNEPTSALVVDALSARGYRVVVARNSAETLQSVCEARPDAILLNIHMPGMHGLDVLQLLRADTMLATVPIIALTARAMPGDRDRCLAAGANDYLSKPFGVHELSRMIAAQCLTRAQK